MRSSCVGVHAAVAMLACSVFGSRLLAAPLYEAAKNNPTFKATTSTNGNTNNLASEGGLGNSYGGGPGFFFVIDDIDNGVDDGLLPDKLNYVFVLTDAQKNAIRNNNGVGRLTVTAARDIGRTMNDEGTGHNPPSEWLGVEIDAEVVANVFLFKETLSTSPPAHTEGNADLTKGPNFNTDFLATDSGAIPQNVVQAAAEDNQIDLALDPTSKVARLKIKTIKLEYNAVPEPPSLVLAACVAMIASVLTRQRPRAAALRRSGG